MKQTVGCNDCENLITVDFTECDERAEILYCPCCGSKDFEVIDNES